MTASKHDSGKPDLSLIPKVAAIRMAEALSVGEKKYSRYNYCEGMKASRIMAALLRHAYSWFDGEETDKEDGHHHLGAVMACAAMLLRQQELNTLSDDRYRREKRANPIPEPKTLWQVCCRSRSSEITLATYLDHETADRMKDGFFKAQWPEPSFSLYLKEVPNDGHQKTP